MIPDERIQELWRRDNESRAHAVAFLAECMPEQLAGELRHLRQLMGIHERKIAEGDQVEYRQMEVNRLGGWVAHIEDLIAKA